MESSDEIAWYLREIAANTRGYTTGPGFVNATLASACTSQPSSSGFPLDPSAPLAVFAVPVNSLWFASLVFSLATASFGMLVKQWLREYLACDYTSPQARLRIRQHRNPSLLAWRVFQIAAILPLLLQLSLALFFIGLCVFTWSINESVAGTTIALVFAWAFLFLASITLPIFFPDCPYRTTAFLRITRFLRLRYTAFRRHVSGACRHLAASESMKEWPRWSKCVLRTAGTSCEPPTYDDEDHIAQNKAQDVDVLISVDAALTDDNILVTTIWDAMQEQQLKPRRVLGFLFEIVRHRLPLPAFQHNSTSPAQLINLRPLGAQGWEAVAEIAASILSRGLDSSAISRWSEEMKQALLILLSYSSYSLPSHHVLLLQQCLEDQNWSTCKELVWNVSSGDPAAQAHILKCFQKPLYEYPLSLAVARFTRLTAALLGAPNTQTALWKLLSERSSEPNLAVVWHQVLDVLAGLIVKSIPSRDREVLPHERRSLQSATLALFHIPVSMTSFKDSRAVFQHLFNHPQGMRTILTLIAGSPAVNDAWTLDRVIDRVRFMYNIVLNTDGESGLRTLRTTLTPISGATAQKTFREMTTTALREYALGEGDISSEWDAVGLNYVRLCRVYLQLFHQPRTISQSTRPRSSNSFPSSNWSELWDVIVPALAKYAVTRRPGELALLKDDALQCLNLLNTLLATELDSDKQTSPTCLSDCALDAFPDAFFATLSLFVPEPAELQALAEIQSRLERSGMLLALPEARLCYVLGEKTIWEYMKDVGAPLHGLFPRLLTDLHTQLPVLRLDSGADDLPDLTSLAERPWTLASDVAAAFILHTLPEDLDDLKAARVTPTDDLERAILLLLSRSSHSLSYQGTQALAACLRKRTRGIIQTILSARSYGRDSEKLTHILHRVRPSIAQLPMICDANVAVNVIAECAFYKFGEGERCSARTIYGCFWGGRHVGDDPFWQAIRNILMDRVGSVAQLVGSIPGPASNDRWVVFDLANCCRIPQSALPEFHDTLRELLLHPTSAHAVSAVYRPVVCLDDNIRRPSFTTVVDGIRAVYGTTKKIRAYWFGPRCYGKLTRAAHIQVRRRFVQVFATIPGNYNANIVKLIKPFNYIRVCLVHLEIFKAHCPLDAGQEISLPTWDLRDSWDNLWKTTAASLRKFIGEKDLNLSAQCEIVLECLTLMDAFEARVQQAAIVLAQSGSSEDGNSATQIPVHSSPFPDELYAALVAFIPESDAVKIASLHHIQHRVPVSHRQISALAPTADVGRRATEPTEQVHGRGSADDRPAPEGAKAVIASADTPSRAVRVGEAGGTGSGDTATNETVEDAEIAASGEVDTYGMENAGSGR